MEFIYGMTICSKILKFICMEFSVLGFGNDEKHPDLGKKRNMIAV